MSPTRKKGHKKVYSNVQCTWCWRISNSILEPVRNIKRLHCIWRPLYSCYFSIPNRTTISTLSKNIQSDMFVRTSCSLLKRGRLTVLRWRASVYLAWISPACEKYSCKKKRSYKIAFGSQLLCQSWEFAALPKLCPHTEYFPLNIGFLFLKISSSRCISSPTVLTMVCGKKNRPKSK